MATKALGLRSLIRIMQLSMVSGHAVLLNQGALETVTFDSADVNDTTDVIAQTYTDMVDGSRVIANAGSGGALPAPLVDGQAYFIGNGIQLYSTYDDARAGTNAINFTNIGSGTGHTLVEQSLGIDDGPEAIILRAELANANGYTARVAVDPAAIVAENLTRDTIDAAVTYQYAANGVDLSTTHTALIFGSSATVGDITGVTFAMIKDDVRTLTDTNNGGQPVTFTFLIIGEDNSDEY